MRGTSVIQVAGGIDPPKVAVARSISTRARRIVLLCFSLLVIICIAAIGSMQLQSTEVDYLTLRVDPAVEINSAIYRDMTEAQGALLRYQLSGDLSLLTPYRAARVRALSALAPLHSKIELLRDHIDESLGASDTQLEAIQQDTMKLWLANAIKSERSVLNNENPNFSQGARLFEDFRRANSELNDYLDSERDSARNRAERASHRGIAAVIAAAIATSIVMLLFGLRLARTISKPIVDLSDSIERQRDGDVDARAQENQGSLETRNLARNFNLLVEQESETRRMQSLALSMHELTVKIEHAIRGASNTKQALEILCVELGMGFEIDRVMTNTLNGDGKLALSAQWHRPDLPPLGDLVDELIPHVSAVSERLWKSSGHIVSNDRLAPEAQDERTKTFYRYTGARAVIITPVGVGDQVIGMIFVLTNTDARDWAEAEVNTVDRVAAFLAQFIVEQTYRDQQNEHVKRLEQLNAQKANFVATVSHELRTPLTSIIGYLEVMREGYAGEVTGEMSQMLDVLDRNASRLLDLIKALLTINQSESVGNRSDFKDVSMREIILSAGADLSSIAAGVSVELDIETCTSEAVVHGDLEQLKSLVTNIISNAIKFSHPGGSVAISCMLEVEASTVRISCQDHGIGIPDADQRELFTRFFRATNATSLYIPGTGLGLSIVKQIVDRHGGKVELTSVEGEGTTVTVELPLSTSSSPNHRRLELGE